MSLLVSCAGWSFLCRCGVSCFVGVVPSCTRHGCTEGLRIGGWGGWMIASVSTHLRLCFGFLFFCVCFFRCLFLLPLLRNWSIRRQVISLALCVRTSRITERQVKRCAYLSGGETFPRLLLLRLFLMNIFTLRITASETTGGVHTCLVQKRARKRPVVLAEVLAVDDPDVHAVAHGGLQLLQGSVGDCVPRHQQVQVSSARGGFCILENLVRWQFLLPPEPRLCLDHLVEADPS